MKKMMKRLLHYTLFILLFTTACTPLPPIAPSDTSSVLDPHGPAAVHLAELWWVMLSFGTAVFVLVVVLLFAALLRGRRATSATAPDSQGGDLGRKWPIWGGIVLPFIVIGIVFVYNVYTLAVVENPQ